MDKIARIRAEIERRIKLYDGNNTQEMWIGNTYRAVLSFLDTLSEEPDKSLEEAAEEYRRESFKRSVTPQIDGPISEYGGSIKDAFIAGAEWQASLMPMPEDTVLFQKGVAEGRRLEKEDMLKDAEECELYWDGDFLAIDLNMVALGYSEKDKVKVIVLKDNEDESK